MVVSKQGRRQVILAAHSHNPLLLPHQRLSHSPLILFSSSDPARSLSFPQPCWPSSNPSSTHPRSPPEPSSSLANAGQPTPSALRTTLDTSQISPRRTGCELPSLCNLDVCSSFSLPHRTPSPACCTLSEQSAKSSATFVSSPRLPTLRSLPSLPSSNSEAPYWNKSMSSHSASASSTASACTPLFCTVPVPS